MVSNVAIRYGLDTAMRSQLPSTPYRLSKPIHPTAYQDDTESVKLVEHRSNQCQINGKNIKASELCLRFLGKCFVARFNQ